MLDDLKYIHIKDSSDALGIAEKQASQLTANYELVGNSEFSGIQNIIYAGMGGSALASLLIHTWPKLKLPFEVVRDYDLPEYVGPQTLVIVASYSGNTEETLSALEQAITKKAQIAVIAGGGKLEVAAREGGYLFGVLPKVVQPRYAVLSCYKLLLDVLTHCGVLDTSYQKELEEVSQKINIAVKSWVPTVKTSDNLAKQIALESLGKSIVVYGGSKMWPVAYKWKISYNENAKQVAWAGQYPEFNHNEFIGWSKQPVDKPYLVIDLRSNLEHERIQKRFQVSERLLSGMRPAPFVVNAEGDTDLQQLIWAIVLGDFATLYTGIANGLDPAPVDLVEKFKKEMVA